MKIFRKKKGNINALIPAAMTFVIVAIVLGISGALLGNIKATQCSINASTGDCGASGSTRSTIASNATTLGIDSIVTISNYLPTLAIIVVLAIIISVIVYFMVGRFGSGVM